MKKLTLPLPNTSPPCVPQNWGVCKGRDLPFPTSALAASWGVICSFVAEPCCSHWRGHPFYKLVCSDPQFHCLLIFSPSIPTGTITSVALTVSFPSRSGFDFFRKAVKRIILCLQIQIFVLVWIYSPCLGQGQLDLFNVQLCLFFFFLNLY